MSWYEREVKAEQLSDEWFEARMGCLTGSIVGDIMPNTRGGYSKAREMLLYRKAVEFMANKDESDPIPKRYSDWGHEYEDEAIRAVSEEAGIPFLSAGLIKSEFSDLVGSSVDSLTENGRVVAEVKCPYYMYSHLKHIHNTPASKLHSDSGYKKYYWQVRHHLLCVGAEEAIWASYYPFFEPKPLFTDIIIADKNELNLLKDECMKFVKDMKLICKRIYEAK